MKNKFLIPLILLSIINLLANYLKSLDLLVGALAGGGILLLIALTSGGIGGADIKLMTILGSVLGFKHILACTMVLFNVAAFISVLKLILCLLKNKSIVGLKLPLVPYITIGYFVIMYG